MRCFNTRNSRYYIVFTGYLGNCFYRSGGNRGISTQPHITVAYLHNIIARLAVRRNAAIFINRTFTGIVGGNDMVEITLEAVGQKTQIARASNDILLGVV